MALDGIAVHALVKQFNNEILSAKVDKIYQPEKDEITVTFRSANGTKKLLLSASSSNPRAHFSEISKKNPLSAPMFCMLLRKHLCGGKLIAVRQKGLERSIDFCIESYTELGDLTLKHLIIEIMGKYSNIILTDDEGKILDSIKHIDFTLSSVRQILPGLIYSYPPPQDKINPLECEYLDVVKVIASADEKIKADKLILQSFEGISPLAAREMCHRALQSTDVLASSLNPERQKALCDSIFSLFDDIKNERFKPCIIYDKVSKRPLDFCAHDIEQYQQMASVQSCSSISEAVEAYYVTRDTEERKKQKTAALTKLVANNIDRCAKKLILLQQTIDSARDREKHKLYADLITANLYRIIDGQKSATVQNFYSQDCEDITIPLDASITPQQNAQKYYKKYNKAKVAQVQAQKQLKIANEELLYLESVMQNISLAADEDDILSIRSELVLQGYVNARTNERKKKNEQPSKPMHFVSSDGFDIYVGKNNAQNDYVTLKLANSSDIWFHTKNFAGSHTIIKLGLDKDVPDRTMLEAASLAAFYSSAKNSPKVEVDYTQIKNVKKPSGAKPGMVIYEHYNTIYIAPDEELAQKLKR